MSNEFVKQFTELSNILDRLLGPGGCPWDQEQTMSTLRSTVLEETCELIEAIDLNNNPNILEEVGDLFLNAIFFCKLAEKEKRFSADQILRTLNEKLIKRHPHVFGDASVKNANEVVDQWHAIKMKDVNAPKSELDSIPKELPGLARAQKAIKRMKKKGFKKIPDGSAPFSNEDELGELLLKITAQAAEKGIDSENALRKKLSLLEQEFRTFEQPSQQSNA